MTVLLLNLLMGAFALISMAWGWYEIKRGRSAVRPVIAFAVFCWIYGVAQPSYLPKGEVRRSTVPEFQEQELEVQDRTSKPMSGEERDRIRHERYRKGLEFMGEED